MSKKKYNFLRRSRDRDIVEIRVHVHRRSVRSSMRQRIACGEKSRIQESVDFQRRRRSKSHVLQRIVECIIDGDGDESVVLLRSVQLNVQD